MEPATFPWDNRERWRNEEYVKDVRYYARAVGLDIIDEQVETDDGYYLRCFLCSIYAECALILRFSVFIGSSIQNIDKVAMERAVILF